MNNNLPYLKGSEYSFFIPIQLCQFALTEKFCNPFRLYCFLKGQCSGKMRITIAHINSFALDLQCDRKSVKNNLNKLITANWIGYNKSSGYYFIRGFESVMQTQGLTSKTGTEFQKSYLSNFKAFVAGAVIGYQVNTIRKKQAAGWKIARPRQAACSSNGYPLSTRLLATKLNVSVGFASKLKELAASAGFIEVNKSYIKTGCPSGYRKFYMKAFPEHNGRIRQAGGQLFLVDSDKIVSNVRFKKRKKRER
jgi:hypothetical protein